MELKDLKEIKITIDCDSEEAAQSIYDILRNALPDVAWCIIENTSGISRLRIYQVINNHNTLSERMLHVSSDIFAKLFLVAKEEVKEENVYVDEGQNEVVSRKTTEVPIKQDINLPIKIDKRTNKTFNGKEWAETPNWEQRRYEIAKDVLAANQDLNPTEQDIEKSLAFADALIERLKKEEIC